MHCGRDDVQDSTFQEDFRFPPAPRDMADGDISTKERYGLGKSRPCHRLVTSPPIPACKDTQSQWTDHKTTAVLSGHSRRNISHPHRNPSGIPSLKRKLRHRMGSLPRPHCTVALQRTPGPPQQYNRRQHTTIHTRLLASTDQQRRRVADGRVEEIRAGHDDQPPDLL